MDDGKRDASQPLLVDVNLARRIEEALALDLVAFARAMAQREPQGGAAYLVFDNGAVAYSGPGLLGARAQGLGLPGPAGPSPSSIDDLDRSIAFLTGHGVPSSVELCPLADTALVASLAAADHRLRGFRDVYAMHLRPLAPEPTPSSTILTTVVGSDDHATWSKVLLDGFGYEPGPRRRRMEEWNAMMAGLSQTHQPQAHLLLAFLDGEPVGASNVIMHQGRSGRIASLGGTATLVPHRRRGVQLALLEARLVLAHQAGCDLAVVTADPGSTSGRNARRAGFTLTYTNVRLQRD